MLPKEHVSKKKKYDMKVMQIHNMHLKEKFDTVF